MLILLIPSVSLAQETQNTIDSLESEKASLLQQQLIEQQISDIERYITKLESQSELDKLDSGQIRVTLSQNAHLREAPNALSESLFSTDLPLTVVVYEIAGEKQSYIKTSINSIVGYVSMIYISAADKEKLSNLIDIKRKERVQQNVLNKKRREAERKKNLQEKYGARAADQIIQGKAWIGMTDDMARESWGEPRDINRTVYSFGVHEQWVYGNGSYLYFEDGKLVTIQQ